MPLLSGLCLGATHRRSRADRGSLREAAWFPGLAVCPSAGHSKTTFPVTTLASGGMLVTALLVTVWRTAIAKISSLQRCHPNDERGHFSHWRQTPRTKTPIRAARSSGSPAQPPRAELDRSHWSQTPRAKTPIWAATRQPCSASTCSRQANTQC